MNQSTIRRFFISLTIVMLSACTNLASVRDTLAQKKVAVTRPADMTFAALDSEKVMAFDLTNDSPVFLFENRKSYFKAFSLPAQEPNQSLLFRSGLWPGTRGNRGALRPVAAFLDENKEVIATNTPAVFFIESDFWSGANYTGRVRIPEAARYVVVLADSHPAANSPEKLPIGFYDDHQSWPTGDLQIQMRTDQVATVADVIERETERRARVFAVNTVNGARVDNARSATRAANSGMGFNLVVTRTRMREVPAGEAKIGLMGTHMMGAPIHEMAARMVGTFFEVYGEVTLRAEPWVHYEVRGNLTEADSTVWIERADNRKKATLRLSTKLRDQEKSKDPQPEVFTN